MHRLTALSCLILFACAAPAMAQTEIHRCIGANGGAVFTDQTCAALQATPVTAATSTHDIPLSAPPPILCAASLGELRQSVVDAFASRDANRMAGLMLWKGYGRGAAIADIRSLAELMKQPLLDLDAPGEPAGADDSTAPATAGSSDPLAPPAPAPAAPASDQLVLHTAGNDGTGNPRETRFGIVRQAGCLWLRNAD